MPEAGGIGCSQMGKHLEKHAWKFGLYPVIYCKTVAQISSITITFGFLYYVTVLSLNPPFMTSKQSTQLKNWQISHQFWAVWLAKYFPNLIHRQLLRVSICTRSKKLNHPRISSLYKHLTCYLLIFPFIQPHIHLSDYSYLLSTCHIPGIVLEVVWSLKK